MSGYRLTVVTTDARRAVRYVTGLWTRPAWLRVVSAPREVAALADGTVAIGLFYEPRARRSPLEWAWIARRAAGGITGLGLPELAGLEAWRERLAAPCGDGDDEPFLRAMPEAVAGMVMTERRTA